MSQLVANMPLRDSREFHWLSVVSHTFLERYRKSR